MELGIEQRLTVCSSASFKCYWKKSSLRVLLDSTIICEFILWQIVLKSILRAIQNYSGYISASINYEIEIYIQNLP